MKRRIKNLLTVLLLMTTLLFSKDIEIPHEIIDKNPEKEVKIVESKKLREKAEMNISVIKKDIKDIEGKKLSKSKIVYQLPEEKDKMIRNEEVIVVKSLDGINEGKPSNRIKRSPSLGSEIESELKISKDGKEIVVENSEETSVYLVRRDRSTGEVYNIYRGINPRMPIDIGTLEMYLDGRLAAQMKRGGYPWITGLGGISGGRHNWNNGYWNSNQQYGQFLKKTAGNIVFPVPVQEWESVENRILLVQSYGDNKTIFSEQGSSSEDGLVMPRRDFPLRPLDTEDKFLKNQIYNVKHMSIGSTRVDKGIYRGDDGQKYTMTMKWVIGPEVSIIGSGEIDLSNMKLGKVYTFDKTIGTSTVNSSEDNLVKITTITGKLPQTQVLEDENVVDELDISINGGPKERIPRLSYTKNSRYDILLDSVSGNLQIKKKKNNETYTDTIEITYLKTGLVTVPIGSYTLKISNKATVDIGELIFNIDSRIKFQRANWIYSNGDSIQSIEGTLKENYGKLVKITNNLKNLVSTKIIEINEIENRPSKQRVFLSEKGVKYQLFYIPSGSYDDESAIPIDILLNNFQDHALISKRNSSFLDNKFRLMGENGVPYEGNIKENFIEKFFEGEATLDLTSNSIDDWGGWEEESSGDKNATTGSLTMQMKFTSGKLFNTKGLYNASMVNRLVVKQDGIEIGDITGTEGDKIEVEGRYNKIGIGTNGELLITKSGNIETPITYEITPYYKDIKLGKLILTVTNNILKEIGEVTFKIDNRYKIKKSRLNWIYQNGNVVSWIGEGVNSYYNYGELLKVSGNFSGGSSIITDVLSIEGRTKDIEKVDGTGKKYMYFMATSDFKDESAIPKEIQLNQLKDNLVVSITNGTDLNLLNNKFKLIADDNIIYSGNIKEEYGTEPENGYEGSGTIDLTKVYDLRKEYEFLKEATEGTINSGELQLNLIGKLPQTQGYNKANIVTNLKVSLNGSRPISINGKKYSNDRYEISLAEGTGNLKIKKKKLDESYTDIVKIDYIYKDIKLGELTLTIINKRSIEIEGGDIIDFGDIVQGEIAETSSIIKMKNFGGEKILKVRVDGIPEMVHEINLANKLPVTLKANVVSEGIIAKVNLDARVATQLTSATGKYEGTATMIITIE